MTVTTSQSTVAYAASAIALGVPLPYNFPLFSADDIGVTYSGATLALNTHYSVAVATDNSSATVTPLAALVALVAQSPGGRLVLQRDMDFTQDTSFSTNTSLPEQSIENAFDRAVMRDQQLEQQIAAMTVPPAAAYTFALSYFGALPTDPGVRPLDGSALQDGDSYFNTSTRRQRIFVGGVWGNGAVTSDELAQVGYRNPGDIYASARLTPAQYSTWADGRALSRTAYPKTFAALTVPAAADFAANVVTLQNVSKDFRNMGLEGAALEAPNGFTAFIVSVTATTITLDRISSITQAAAPLTLLPWGRGDGTTFNVPDMRGCIASGRDNQGGTLANVVTFPQALRLGGGVGEATHALGVSELPVTQLTATATATQAPHTHTVNIPALDNATFQQTTGGANSKTGVPGGTTAGMVTGSTTPVITASVTIAPFGGGVAHNNLQPTKFCNYFVFLGE